MAKFKVTGMDDILGDLKNISRNVEKLSGKKLTPFQLLTPGFINAHTGFKDLVSFLQAGGFAVSCDDDIGKLKISDLDVYITANTEFDTFEDMLVEAQADMLFSRK